MHAQATAAAESATLYYRAGGSDKVYQVAVEPTGTGFTVNFAFGRRGSTLQTGTKTPQPLAYEQAKKVFDQLVREKTAKGYSPGAGGTPYANTPQESRSSGVLPQLLNPVEEADVERLLDDLDWWMQEKLDGRRALIRKQGAEVVGINRTGLLIGLSRRVVEAVQSIAADSCLLDGEAVGDAYHAFDLLERDGSDLRASPYALRYDGAMDLVDAVPSDVLRFVETATTVRTKRAMIVRFQASRKEGVVFKQRDAAYVPGRPASGGTQLKLKFYATASCVVAKASGTKRSVALELYEERGGPVPVGNVTVPPNHPVPKRGDVVDVRYLYAYSGGSLYQPVYLGRRDDVPPADCATSQLKFKAVDDEQDEAA
jgi:bifunctional non-homologous end joining protein LigD